MSPGTARRIALGLAGLAVGLLVAGFALFAAGRGIHGSRVYSALGVAVFSTVGVVIAARHPSNPIGWLFCAVAVAAGLGTLSDAYASFWLDGRGSRGLGQAAAVYEDNGWVPGVLVPVTFVLLLFPDGRLLSPRWRPVAWSAAVGMVGFAVGGVLAPGRLEDFPGVANPYGVDSPARDVLLAIAAPLLVVGVVASPVSLVVRLRRSHGAERQQLKWLAWAGALAGVVVVVGSVGYDVWGEGISNAAILLSVLALPVATGVAILRYRLYDIDVVINRTLVYSVLTATLAGTYLVSVLVLQLVLSAVTRDSSLVVAGSTLAVAGLFRPARARIQALVDRRFYRRRYDAQRTLEAYARRLRSQVELEALTTDLAGVVRETLEPAHVSLWLRDRAEDAR
jgi:MFS family permease